MNPDTNEDLLFQLALCQVKEVGVLSAKKLIAHFGMAKEVFLRSSLELMQVPGITLPRAQSIAAYKNFDRVHQEIEFCSKNDIRLVSYLDKEYPQRLKHCDDGPVVLFTRGNMDMNANKMISVVGTRQVSPYGRKVTEELIESFVAYNITVVSGLAYGVDILAHRAAMEQGLQTIGVLGHGLDTMYPPEHRSDAQAMQTNGGLVSEFFSGSNPDRENFPKRNRIVAGMCDATIVVESGAWGGSIITAELANSYNRDVFAIPGRINDTVSVGCNKLIKANKAALLESVKDLEYIMGWKKVESRKAVQTKIFVDLNKDEESVIEYLKNNGQSQIDMISIETGLPVSMVMVALLNLELNGLVRSLPGKFFELA